MKINKNWLNELIELAVPIAEVERLLPLKTIGTKEITEDVMELDMKGYNRSDLLYLRGVAQEVAAITNSKLLFTTSDETNYPWLGHKLPETPIKIQDKKLSLVQCVAKIEGLKFDKSPQDWVQKLASCGMRTVNNIADVTNLIMMEYGQPLHAFDASTVKNELINVRLAKNGEQIKTLDNKLRTLTSEDIVLADTEKALDVAGVMGGKDTEITQSSTTILLSASLFNPTMIRKTSSRLGLYSEASKRFQYGLTKTNLLQAFSTAIKMYQDLGGKLTAINLVGDFKDKLQTIILTQEKINSLIGVKISPEKVESFLIALGFKLVSHTKKEGIIWDVTVPYWRLDIAIEEDLIEEVARMYGYENIPAILLKGTLPQPIDQKLFHFLYDLKAALTRIGLTEVQTYSFYSTQVLNNFQINKENLIKIANPISTETEYMKDNLWPNLVKVACENLKNRDNLAIFEVAKVYLTQKNDLPKEEYRLSIALSSNSTVSIEELYFIFLKISENFKFKFEIKSHKLKEQEKDLYHPTRFAEITHQGKIIGLIAEIHPKILDKFGTDKRIAVLEISL